MRRRTVGRAALVTRGTLWTSDGRSLVAADVLGLPVVAAAFTDARFGAAALEDGTLALTRDGGARWERVPLGGDLVIDVKVEDGLRVSLVGRSATLRPDGTLTTAAASRDTRAHTEIVRATSSARDARANRFTLASGAWVGMSVETIEVGSAHGRRFALRSSRESLVRRWGDGLAIVADDWYRFDSEGRMTLLRGPDGTTRFPREDLSVVWSDDGRHAAWVGVCPIPAPREEGAADTPDEPPVYDEEEAPGRTEEAPVLCVLDDGLRRWRKVSLPDARTAGLRWTLVGLHGARALLRNELDATEYATFDLDSDRRGAIRLRDPSVALTSLGWVADGSLCGTGERCGDGCEPVVVCGPADGLLDATPAPAALLEVAFADALHGAARSEDGATLWRTLDGGRRWERVVDDLPHARDLGPSLECGATGCDLGGEFHLHGWGPLRPRDTGLTLASPRDREPERPRSRESARGENPRTAEVRCTDEGRPRRSPWSARRDGVTMTWPGGVGSFALRGASSVVTWQGHEGRGAVTFPAPLEFLQQARPDGSILHAGSSALVATTTDRVLWLDRRGAREVTHPATGRPLRASPTNLNVARDPEGGVALQYATFTIPDALVALALDARGAVRSWRAVLRRSEAVSALAFHQGRWGHILSGDPATRFEPLDGTEPTSLPAWRGSMHICAGPPAPGAVALHVGACQPPGQPCLRAVSRGHVVRERLVVELAREGACVRALEAEIESSRGGGQDVHSAQRLDAQGGELVGFVDDGAQRQSVRCAHPANAPRPSP